MVGVRAQRWDGYMKQRLIGLASAGAIAVLLAACGSSSSTATSTSTGKTAPTTGTTLAPSAAAISAKLAGIGATVARIMELHGRDEVAGGLCSSGPVCFGAPIRNTEGDKFQFANVSVTDGIVNGYTQAFPTDTNLSTARSEILLWLPRDATISALTVNHNGGSCAQFDVKSPTLATVFSAVPAIGDPQGVLGVTLSYSDANKNVAFDPHNIQNARISTTPTDPTATC
jgi:hypothetical protein